MVKEAFIFTGMNIQILIVAILFLSALFYVGQLIYNSITVKKSCGSNCKCGVDFSNVEMKKAST